MITILTLNVNGLRDPVKRGALLNWVASSPTKPNLLCLQEIHCSSPEELLAWFSQTAYTAYGSFCTRKSAGVAILVSNTFKVTNEWADQQGRFLQLELCFASKYFRVCSIYAPNRNPERNLYFEDIASHFDPTTHTLLCGDFNAVFDRGLDRRGSDSQPVARDSSRQLAQLFSAAGVVDIWRHLHPTLSSFTWTKPNGRVASRIDLVGIPHVWIPGTKSCIVIPCPHSDHAALLFTSNVPDLLPNGPGYWKLNTDVLNDPPYIDRVTLFWTHWRTQKGGFSSLLNWWDQGKARIKQLTIRYCTQRARSKRAARTTLEQRANHLKDLVDQGLVSGLGDYKRALHAISVLDKEEAQGARIRSRVRWAEEGETSSAFFLRLEKKGAARHHIDCVKLDDGSYVNDTPGLLNAWAAFYQGLFRAEPTDVPLQRAFLDRLERSLDQDSALSCEGLLSLDECLIALKGMARNKTPGMDGLPMEFYLAFWELLGTDLVATLNLAHIQGILSLSQRRGLISLLFKKGLRYLRPNWRPLTMLSVDYKIASRCMAGRLLKVIHLVVSPDQTCSVPGRFIGENVALLRDLVDYTFLTDSPLAILSLDQEKAFDRVDWDFLLGAALLP